jgi:DNA polymerase III epsilon subunit-like protein
MKYLFFDTETTGLPKNREDAIKGPGNWPHIVSLSWQVYENFKHIKSESYIIKPMEWIIPEDSIKIHGITNEKALVEGHDLLSVINKFMNEKSDYLIAHNMDFDYKIIHYYPQYLFICDENLDIPKNIKINKLEYCEQPKQYNLINYFDDECINIINNIYRNDFLFLNYNQYFKCQNL